MLTSLFLRLAATGCCLPPPPPLSSHACRISLRIGCARPPANPTLHDQEYIIPDAKAAAAAGADYLPVVFPGGSAHYEPRVPVQPFNRCPRDGGRFLWRQLYNALAVAKVDMLYGAMFDEVSEGTAFYKIAKSKNDVPANAQVRTPFSEASNAPAVRACAVCVYCGPIGRL